MIKWRHFVFALLAAATAAGSVVAQDQQTTPYERPDRSLDTLGIPGTFERQDQETHYIFPDGIGGPGIGGAFFRAEYLLMKPRRRSMVARPT